MTATEKRLQEIKGKRMRTEDIILAAMRKAVLSSMWLEVWTGDQVITLEGAANQIFNDWFENEDGDVAIDRLVTLIIH